MGVLEKEAAGELVAEPERAGELAKSKTAPRSAQRLNRKKPARGEPAESPRTFDIAMRSF